MSGKDDPLFYTVEDHSRGPVGIVSFLNIAPLDRRLEVGHIWYRPSAQQSRTNTESVYLMLKEAFDLLYRRVEWKCDSLNERSRRAAVRLGFHFEGVFPKHMIVKSRNRDTAWFAMLDDEWPACRRALEE